MGIQTLRFPISDNILRRILSSVPGICSTQANRRILNYDQSGRIYGLTRPGGQQHGARLVSVLSELKVGESGVVEILDLPESVQNYLMHLGFLPSALVTVLRRAPAGDPTVYAVDGMEIALRHETASAIHVRQPEDAAVNAPAFEQSEPEMATVDPDVSLSMLQDAPSELIEVAR